MKSTLVRAGLVALMVGAVAGCGGGGGGGGDAGVAAVPPPAAAGPTLPAAPVPTGTAAVNLATITADQFAALQPTINVGGAIVASPPQVSFAIQDQSGNPIKGLAEWTTKSATATVASYPNIAFSIAKLVPGTNGSPSKWVSYIVTTVPTTTTASAPTRPSTDNTGTLTDNGNGTYTYKFYRDIAAIKDSVAAMTVSGSNNKADLGDLTYDANAVHRITIQFAGNARGTGTNTADGSNSGVTAVPLKYPLNVIYDFIPATGKAVAPTDATTQRLIVDRLSCNECHTKLGGIPGTESASFHGGSRYDPKYCVVCHTDQRKYGRTNSVSTSNTFTGTTYVADGVTIGDFPVLIHRVHKGEELIKQGYNFAGVLLNETTFPQDIRNCNKCHDNTSPKVAPQATNYQTVPSRLACGACHDGIDFSTGTGTNNSTNLATGLHNTWGHLGGKQTDDSKCALCHDADSIKSVYHLAITPPNAGNCLQTAGGSCNSNAAWIASNRDNLPTGAIKIDYDVKSVSRDANKKPVIVFKLLQNGVAKTFNDPATKTEMWDGFFGSPSVYFVWAVPQDGVTAPADFNASASGFLRNIWNGTATGTGAGTLSAPDADGYYSVTLTGVTVPDSAVMLSGGLGYTYNVNTSPPLTQTGVTDPIQSNTTFNQVRFGTSTSTLTLSGYNKTIGGLIVVTPDKQTVGAGYTGRRAIVDDAKCNACHKELGLFTASSFHGGQRNDGTTCAWCHNPNRASSGWSADSTYFVHAIHSSDFRNKPFTWHATAVGKGFQDVTYPAILNKCEMCHTSTGYDFGNLSQTTIDSRLYRTVAGNINATTDLAIYSLSPYVTNATNYGSGFSFNAGTQVTTAAAATTLVISPIATACFACHDSDVAKQHMEGNGASIYAARDVALAKKEQCLFCHQSDSVYGLGIKAVHSK